MNDLWASLGVALRLILNGDATLASVVGRSLAVSTTACVIACVIGLVAGTWLDRSRLPALSPQADRFVAGEIA
jgi:ABC-type tungstate transport system substrate-binding protein